MKAGRNDPCPCGSGKKYKKCCLAKDQEASLRQTAVIPPPPSSVAPPRPVPFPTQQHPQPAGPTAPARAAEAPTPPLPLDPVTERGESRWREFESQNGEGRIAVFFKTLEDAEVMTDDLAFEMLNILHTDAVKSGGRTRFAECVGALRDAGPRCLMKELTTICPGACWTPWRRAGRRLSPPWRGSWPHALGVTSTPSTVP